MEGLIAATFTPMDSDGSLNTLAIAPMVDFLIDREIAGLYVLGSTGEGPSLTFDERCTAAAAFVRAAGGRVPVIVQVGCESLTQAAELATAAQAIGADAISAVSPVYFKPDSVATLVDSMAVIAAGAGQLPFYYYHIPAATGVAVNVVEFLKLSATRIANLRGIKFTSPLVHEFQACVEYAGDRFEMLWGSDEMLLCGLTAGAKAAVGSTYNFSAAIYSRMMAALAAGDLQTAIHEQSRSQAVVRTFVPYGPRAAQKAMMAMVGFDCGPTRLPISPLDASRYVQLQRDLREIGFFEWIEPRGALARTRES